LASQTTSEERPGDEYARKYKTNPQTGKVWTMVEDCSDNLKMALQDSKTIKYGNYYWTLNTNPDYGEPKVFRQTEEQRKGYLASFNNKKQGGVLSPSTQARIDNMSTSEYKSLTSPVSKEIYTGSTTTTATDWNPPQLILVPIKTLTHDAGWNVVHDNEQAGWKAIKMIEIENFYAVVMKRV
jgi:hypothetical protein